MAELTVRFESPEETALLAPAMQALEQMEAMDIDSPAMAQTAADERGAINKALKVNEERRLAIVRKIDEAKEPVNSLFRPITEVLMKARAIIDAKLVAWNKKVDDERRALEAAASEKLRKEQERLAAQAAKAEEKGHTEKAEVLRETAAAMPTAVVLPPAPKVEGMIERITYGAECYDVVALCAHIVAHPEDRALVDPNRANLNARARSQRDAFKLAGCTLVKKAGIASRAA